MSDLISREAVIDWLTDRADLYDAVGHIRDKEEVRKEIAGYIAEIPSVTPKQRTGHWKYYRRREEDGECPYGCSECRMGSDVDYDYCMRCGAKMVEPQESEGA